MVLIGCLFAIRRSNPPVHVFYRLDLRFNDSHLTFTIPLATLSSTTPSAHNTAGLVGVSLMSQRLHSLGRPGRMLNFGTPITLASCPTMGDKQIAVAVCFECRSQSRDMSFKRSFRTLATTAILLHGRSPFALRVRIGSLPRPAEAGFLIPSTPG
jgi:hypothetical protein